MNTLFQTPARNRSRRQRLLAGLFAALLACFLSPTVRAADALVDGAVNALAQLTDPRRLEPLPDPAFRARLGPALGWLHVARRRDVSPESVLSRAFALNGLDAERARSTREALLRNLARADAWELFAHETSARALANGQPAPIQTGTHRGHLAQAAVVPSAQSAPQACREFACLVLRADDELPPSAPPIAPSRRRTRRAAGDLLAQTTAAPAPARPLLAAGGINAAPAFAYDDALPVDYTMVGHDSGTIRVRVEAVPGRTVDLAVYGGPPLGFLLRGMDAGTVRFSVLDANTLAEDAPVQTAVASGVPSSTQAIHEQPGAWRVSLCGPATVGSGARTLLFEFPVRDGSAHPAGR